MPTIPLSSIDRSNRAREKYEGIEALANSIEELGLIQPVVLDDANNLIAGGRRLAAADLLGIEELEEGLTCVPGKLGFVRSASLRPDQRLELELEENLQRMAMEWTEEILLVYKIHREKQRQSALDPSLPKWGLRQTGALLNQSFGNVQYCVVVGELLLAKDPEIMKCSSLSDCLKVLHKRAADAGAKIVAEKAGLGGAVSDDLIRSLGLDDTSPTPSTPSSGSKIDQDSGGSAKPTGMLTGPSEVPLSRRLFLGDSVNDIMPRMPDACMDHIVTDIPYGIDMDNLQGMKNIERVEKEHDVAENVGLMQAFLVQAFRLLKPGGFCVFWCDLDHWEKLQTWANAAGFRVQRWPLIWCKDHPCRNNAAGYNFTKTEEYAMVCCKEGSVLQSPQRTSRVHADGSIERKHYMNPFAKPFKVWQFIFDAIAFKGQTVLDPFAGEMSSCRAAVLLGLQPFAIELNPAHYNAGIEQVKSAYQMLTSNQVSFT